MKHTPTPLSFTEDAIDGYESIVIEHKGCPILTVRGLYDMSCVDEEDEDRVAAETVATANRVIMTYNHHDQLVEALRNLVNEFTQIGYPTHTGMAVVYLEKAQEVLKQIDDRK
jgi:Xaa-Pro aminopeptidase